MAFIGSSKHIFVAAAATAAITAAQPAAAQNRPAYLANFPNFEPKLTPGQLPGDVDTALQKQYEGSKEFAKVQRVFDLWSWQAFVSLNWPTDDHGHRLADAKDTSEASPAWTLWTDSTDIFLPKGAAPAICAKPAAELALSLTRNTAVPVAPGLQPFTLAAEFDKRKTRLLGNISAVGELSAIKLGDIKQAFSGPLVDQNGNFVYYEIMMNPHEVRYTCENKLYSIDGQIEFAKTHKSVDLPSGADTQDASGAFEVKLAWKILEAGDDPARYLSMPAKVATAVNGKQVDKDVRVGLVGMHSWYARQSSSIDDDAIGRADRMLDGQNLAADQDTATKLRGLEKKIAILRPAIDKQREIVDRIRGELSVEAARLVQDRHRKALANIMTAARALVAAANSERAIRGELLDLGFEVVESIVPPPRIAAPLILGDENVCDSPLWHFRRQLEDLGILP